MPRNYKKELEKEKEKYKRFIVKVNLDEYGETYNEVKNKFGNAEFLRRAYKLYSQNPDLFLIVEKEELEKRLNEIKNVEKRLNAKNA
ncbi:MAG: hypothetical protein ABF289_07785 [Clostridiales bacterium]